MEQKKITVIMGIYNCQNTIIEAFNSLKEQTYDNWNIIMCDDGSTDRTYEIATEIMNNNPDRVMLIKNDVNRGLNYTLNKCLSYVESEYVARMDADDISLPTRFEKEIEFLSNHSEYDFVSTPMILFDENGDWGCDWGIEKPEAIDLLKSRPFCHACCMIRTTAFKNVNGYSEDKRLLRVEDLHLWMKLYANEHKGYNIQEPLYKMRDDREAYARRKFKYRLNEFYVNVIMVKTLKLNKINYLYSVRPLIVGILPPVLYDFVHKKRLQR